MSSAQAGPSRAESTRAAAGRIGPVLGRGWRAFKSWRRVRPFWAGLFILVSGVPILVFPYSHVTLSGLTMSLATTAGAGSAIIGILMFVLGLTLWFQPMARYFVGVAAIILAIVSLVVSNFGGFGLGLIPGLIGGALAVSWAPVKQPDAGRAERRTDDADDPDDDADDDGSGDDGNGGGGGSTAPAPQPGPAPDASAPDPSTAPEPPQPAAGADRTALRRAAPARRRRAARLTALAAAPVLALAVGAAPAATAAPAPKDGAGLLPGSGSTDPLGALNGLGKQVTGVSDSAPFANGPCPVPADKKPKPRASSKPKDSKKKKPGSASSSKDPKKSGSSSSHGGVTLPKLPGTGSGASPSPSASDSPSPSPSPSKTKSAHPVKDFFDNLFGIKDKNSASPSPTPSASAPAAKPSAPGAPAPKPSTGTGGSKADAKPKASPSPSASKDAKDPAKQDAKKKADKSKALSKQAEAKKKWPYKCPTERPKYDEKTEPGVNLPKDAWHLSSSKLTLYGFYYHGIVTVNASGVKKKVMKFTANAIDIGDLNMTVPLGNGTKLHVVAAKGSTSTIRHGKVTMYCQAMNGNLFGLLPSKLRPKFPQDPFYIYPVNKLIGPLPIPVTYTDVTLDNAGQFGGELHIPGMKTYGTPTDEE